jgi:glycerol-3-phosphate dehydrogenase
MIPVTLDEKWRNDTWSNLDQDWDIIVIGGGITGAGVFNMAAQKGLKVILLEANDFGFGTSSRSSKLVHGGIRYLRNRQFDVVKESVKERERLLQESNGLVDPLRFIFPSYEDFQYETKMMRLGVILYDLLAPKWQHRNLNKTNVIKALSPLSQEHLLGGVEYCDARVDDIRLVLRVIMDGLRFGGYALNYAKVISVCKSKIGQVEGVIVQDQSGELSPKVKELKGKVIINATGPWSDQVRHEISGEPKLRPLRGSHLLFHQEKLPIRAAVTMLHPRDGRALFAVPWENRTLIGTTDLDHELKDDETCITQSEVDYLLEAAQYSFKGSPVTREDIVSTFSGLRPVINTNAPNPSKESRAHQIWEEDGLVSVAGGKLTIFRVMAADALNFCRGRLPGHPTFDHRSPCFFSPQSENKGNLSNPLWVKMAGKLGQNVNIFFNESDPDQLTTIESIPGLWAELPWAAKYEAVLHLDDLLLRRVRLGILLENGGIDHLEKIKHLTSNALNWSDDKWKVEVSRYKSILQNYYSIP